MTSKKAGKNFAFAMIALIGIAVSACDPELIPDSANISSAELAYDRGKRIQALLAECEGAAKPQANSASASVASAGNSLIALVNQNESVYGGVAGWLNEEKKRLEVFEIAQVEAYNAAVACGLVAPGNPEPGSWSSTWWDISSP